MAILVDIREFEAPEIGCEMGSGAPLPAPAFCRALLHRLDYVFYGRSTAAPALWIAGGVLGDGTPVSGAGSQPDAALIRLTGEAAEQLALRQPLPDWARDLTSGARVALPAGALPWPGQGFEGFSEGLAAHADIARARQHGICELIERDAVRKWWAGQGAATFLNGAQAIVDAVLGPGRARRTCLLELPGAAAVPVVVAASFEGDGRGFCFGAAARAGRRNAAHAALRELGASEFGLGLARQRDAAGQADASGDMQRARLVDQDGFFRHLVNPQPPEPEPDAPDWQAVLAAVSAQEIILDLPETPFTAVKTLSSILNMRGNGVPYSGSDAAGARANGPFGVAIY